MSCTTVIMNNLKNCRYRCLQMAGWDIYIYKFFGGKRHCVYWLFWQKCHTINGDYCTNLLRPLRKAIKRKHPGKLEKNVLFYQDSVPTHTSLVSMDAVSGCGFKPDDNSPYYPFFAPSDNHLFLNMKKITRLVTNLAVMMTSFLLLMLEVCTFFRVVINLPYIVLIYKELYIIFP